MVAKGKKKQEKKGIEKYLAGDSDSDASGDSLEDREEDGGDEKDGKETFFFTIINVPNYLKILHFPSTQGQKHGILVGYFRAKFHHRHRHRSRALRTRLGCARMAALQERSQARS